MQSRPLLREPGIAGLRMVDVGLFQPVVDELPGDFRKARGFGWRGAAGTDKGEGGASAGLG